MSGRLKWFYIEENKFTDNVLSLIARAIVEHPALEHISLTDGLTGQLSVLKQKARELPEVGMYTKPALRAFLAAVNAPDEPVPQGSLLTEAADVSALVGEEPVDPLDPLPVTAVPDAPQHPHVEESSELVLPSLGALEFDFDLDTTQ
eukprot:m.431763 g.431763  ORF g.431763 m.431763 type:complete len:147 (-) comp56741_c2_seq8:25-465(-)